MESHVLLEERACKYLVTRISNRLTKHRGGYTDDLHTVHLMLKLNDGKVVLSKADFRSLMDFVDEVVS